MKPFIWACVDHNTLMEFTAAICNRINYTCAVLAMTCRNVCHERGLLAALSTVPGPRSHQKDTKSDVWTPEVGWLHPLGLCIALPFFKQSPQWRHRRDNPAVSQILTGNEPLMGASNETVTYFQPCFNQRKEFGKGTGAVLKAAGVLVQYYCKWQTLFTYILEAL